VQILGNKSLLSCHEVCARTASKGHAVRPVSFGKYADALPALDRAIALRPTYVNALMNRGDIYNFYYQIDRARAGRLRPGAGPWVLKPRTAPAFAVIAFWPATTAGIWAPCLIHHAGSRAIATGRSVAR
jgi:hypothetical protein